MNIAEPKALIGFAGARVAAGTIAEELPEGFQRAEFLFEHGFVDLVVTARRCATSSRLLRYLRADAVDDGRQAFRGNRPLLVPLDAAPSSRRLATRASGRAPERGRPAADRGAASADRTTPSRG